MQGSSIEIDNFVAEAAMWIQLERTRRSLQQDNLYDQMSIKVFIDSFTGEQVRGDKKEKPLKC